MVLNLTMREHIVVETFTCRAVTVMLQTLHSIIHMLPGTVEQYIQQVHFPTYLTQTSQTTLLIMMVVQYSGLEEVILNIMLLMVVYSQIILLMLLVGIMVELLIVLMVSKGRLGVEVPFTGLKMEPMVLLEIVNSIIILFNPLKKLMGVLFYGIKVIMVVLRIVSL